MFYLPPLSPAERKEHLTFKSCFSNSSRAKHQREEFVFLKYVGNWNEHHCTTATFSLNPDLLSLTACTLIKASLILFALFSTTLPARNGFHKARAVISVNGGLLFLWLQAKASREEEECLRVGRCPESISAPAAALSAGSARTSLHPLEDAFVCVQSRGL